MVKMLKSQDADFEQQFEILLKENRNTENDVSGVVKDILKDVKINGDEALLRYTEKFDSLTLTP